MAERTAPSAIAKMTDLDLVSTLDLDIPQFMMNEIFRKFGTQGIAYLMVRSLGFERPVAADEYGHFEKEPSYENIKVAADVAASAANAVQSIVLHADSLSDASPYNFFPRVRDLVMYPDETAGIITAISGAGTTTVTLSIYPIELGANLPAVSASDELVIYSSVASEGSGFPDPVSTITSKYTNYAQIIKDKVAATGTALTTASYIEAYNKAGQFQGYYSEAIKDLDYRMLTKIDGMFWWGKLFTNTTGSINIDSGTSRAYKTSKGLIPSVRDEGQVDAYTPGQFDVEKFDTYDRLLVKQFVDSSVPMWNVCGLELYQEIENTLKEYFADTNISFVRQVVNSALFKGDESLGASINFKYLQKSGRVHMFYKNDGWSNPRTYGSLNFETPKMALMIPLDKQKDPVTKEDIPSIGTRYRQMGAYNRRMIVSTLAGIGASYDGKPIDEIDSQRHYQFAHMGNEFFGLNRFILIDPS